MSELQQQKKDANQRFILSPEQQAEVDNFRKKQAEVSRELRQAQKDLRKEVVSLETRLEWLNILAMPLRRDAGRHRASPWSNAKRLQPNESETIHHLVGARRRHRRGGIDRSPAQQPFLAERRRTTIGQKLLPNLAVNDIAQITIQSGTNELNLAKRDNLWRVRERGDYPANFSQISDLLLKLADLKIVQTRGSRAVATGPV